MGSHNAWGDDVRPQLRLVERTEKKPGDLILIGDQVVTADEWGGWDKPTPAYVPTAFPAHPTLTDAASRIFVVAALGVMFVGAAAIAIGYLTGKLH
jgi:hypothetical protein